MINTLSVSDLLNLKGTTRTVRAYAFLEASLSVSQNSDNPAQDALDCIIPFLGAGIAYQNGEQLDYKQLKTYLNSQFGFDIPIYALEQFSRTLADRGYLKYERSINAYVCKDNGDSYLKERRETLSSFDSLERELTRFAATEQLETPPVSPTWLDALISFLRNPGDDEAQKPVRVKHVITNKGPQIERYVIGRFIENTHRSNPTLFASIVSVFKGIIIEDFISGGLQTSNVNRVNDLTIYYDTAVIMRLMGCSGRLHEDAATELHRYLHDIGCATQFLRVTESEVDNILSTLVGKKDSGISLFGETSDAIERGEFSIQQLRLLNGRFVEKLALLNIFEAKDTINRIHNAERFQIGEKAFERFLKEEATKRGTPYKSENLTNDAQALSAVMLYRRGQKAREVLKSRFIFVTTNTLLAHVSRRFLIAEGDLKWTDCPPILHVGQLTTIMWILKNRKLEDKLVTRELLASCYAAYRPDAEWVDKFMESLKAATELAGKGAENVLGDSVTLQAARRIAQDQSYGRTALLEKLDLAAVLAMAEQEKKELIDQQTAVGRAEGHNIAVNTFMQRQRTRADQFAERVIKGVELLVIAIAILSAIALLSPLKEYLPPSFAKWAAGISAPFGVLSTLDLFGFNLVRPLFERLRVWLANLALRIIEGNPPN